VADILKGISGGWSFLVSWVFPSLLAWLAFSVFALPHLERISVFASIAANSETNRSVLIAGASLLTGLLLSTLSTVLFRILEGYILLPEVVASKMRARQVKAHSNLRKDLSKLLDERGEDEITGRLTAQTGLNVRIGLIREQLRRYPAEQREFSPTRFSNALRAIETFGWDRYRFDSQTLWSELQSVVPDTLRQEQDNARAPINFFVSLIYLSALEAMTCLALSLQRPGNNSSLIVVGVVCISLVPCFYRLAVINTRYLLSVMQATVNVGRVDLAAKMGLILPAKLRDERDMWERVYWFVQDPLNPVYIEDLDSYRSAPP
jgi:hypothetical protein